jgi:hypothetical protein
MSSASASDELVELYLELAADSAGRVVGAEPYDGGAAVPVPGPRYSAPRKLTEGMYLSASAFFRIATTDVPRVRYLPMPRVRVYRPFAGRSTRGRRVRTQRSARAGPVRKRRGSDDPPPSPDVALPRAA